MYCLRCGTIQGVPCEEPQVWALLVKDRTSNHDDAYMLKRITIHNRVDSSGHIFNRHRHSMGLCPSCILNEEGDEHE